MNKKIDIIAEDIVINLLKLYGHEFVIKPPSSTNPNWDIVEYAVENKSKKLCKPIYYQIKSHNWDRTNSHAINGKFANLKRSYVNYLIIFIIKDRNIEIYGFDIKKEIRAKKKNEKKLLFDKNKRILFSRTTSMRKTKQQTISLNTFYSENYKQERDKYKLKYIKK